MDCEAGCPSPTHCNPSAPTEPIKPQPFNNNPPDWVAHVRRTKMATDSFNNCGVMCFTLLLLILCIASYMFCQECLFVLLIVSACLCPFFHPLNAPLWLAILLLTIGGWSFTAGAMEIRWKSHV